MTEERSSARQREEFAELIEQFARSAEVGLVLRQATQTLYMSPGLLRMMGLDPDLDEPSLLVLRKMIHPDDREAAAAMVGAADRGEPNGIEMRIIRPDGEIRWIKGTNDPVALGNGVYRVASTYIDITDRKRAELEARTAQSEAENSNKAKTEFLSRMSHELRTPLNAILGFAQLLEMDELSVEHRDSVRHIVLSGELLLGLIDEVLDISRMEAGTMRLSLEPVRLSDVIDEGVGMLGPLAERRGVRIVADPLDPDVHVQADRQRFKQVVVNLVANAVKYNQKDGQVSIRTELLNDGELLRLTVVDTGIGIAEEDLDRLFRPFERLLAVASHIEGTGLGLALTKQLMTAMGGAVGVSSLVGEGSSFWVEIPTTNVRPLVDLGEQSRAEPDREPKPMSGRRTILYVEDNLSNVRLLERVIARRPGIVLTVAMQGRVALDMAFEIQPDLILLDLHLPDISGEEVLRELRSDPRTAETPIVITSADANAVRPTMLFAQGATHYLTKPFDIPRLLAVIDSLSVPRHHMGGENETEAPYVEPEQNVGVDNRQAVVDPDSPALDILEFAHDVNNELSVILGYAGLLADDPTNQAATADLTTIREAAERAVELTRRLSVAANKAQRGPWSS
jgi:PAS domain S-box-containing protein